MDTEKAWEEFQANDSSIRKSESVQQDIQQILDTVTQIKTDVDQLKAEGPQATGSADEDLSLSAPEEQQPSPDMTDGMPPAPDMGAEPQTPMGDLDAQPEDGSATPMPEESAPDMGANAEGGSPYIEDNSGLGDIFSDFDMGGGEEESDEDVLLDTARQVKDPNLKQQLLAMVYQLIEDQKGAPMPPIEEAAPMMEPAPEEILAAAMDANGDGMLSEEEVMPMMRSAATTDTVQCDKPPAEQIMSTVQNSDEEKKDDGEKEDKKEESDEKKDDDDKSERPKKEEPGVNDELPEKKEEDKDSLEELPEVTEVKIETEEPKEEISEEVSEEVPEEDNSEIDRVIDTVLDDAKREIKEQIVSASNTPFFLSTSEMMSIRRSGGSHRSFRTEPMKKAIEWPDTFEGLTIEDKCRLFAKSFSQMPEAMQDNVVTLMDTRLGSEATSAIFKSEGVDLDAYYEPIMKSPQDHEGYTDGKTVTGESSDSLASDNGEGMTESCEESTVEESLPVTEKEVPKFSSPGPKGWQSAAKTKVKQVPKFGVDGPEGWMSAAKTTIQDSTESLEACQKSATPEGVGMHIPTVSEMMQFKKSGTSFYTPISREAAEPHGLVAMGPDKEIPSVKEMFAKRFGN